MERAMATEMAATSDSLFTPTKTRSHNGAAAGAFFAALPRAVRRSAWSGPVFGLPIWTGFEPGIAPLLALSHAQRGRVLDRLVLAGDHLLYGFILSENATLRSDGIERDSG